MYRARSAVEPIVLGSLVPLQAASSRFAEPQGFHGVAAGKQRTKQRDCFERLATALLRCGEQDLNR